MAPWEKYQPQPQVPASGAPWTRYQPQDQNVGPADRTGAFLTGIAEGVPIAGPKLLQGLEVIGAWGRHLRSGKPFADEFQTVQHMTQQVKKEHPYINFGGNVVGAIGGLAPLAATGVGSAALGLRGPSLMLRSLASAGSGAAIGGADTYVRSGGDLTQAAKGAAYGAAGGAAAPFVANVIGKGAEFVADKFTRPGQALSEIPRDAVNFAAKTVPNQARSAAMQRELAQLGPDATLADVSPEWMAVARGTAARPGLRDEIAGFFNTRGAGANQRLATDFNRALGPVRAPSEIEMAIRQAQQGLSPYYEGVLANAKAVNTQPIANNLDAAIVNLRGPAQQALRRVRSFLNIPGNQGVLDTNPRALFETRKAIDGLLSDTQNRAVIRVLTDARRAVDDALATAVPGIKAVDAQFAGLARQSEGLQRGSELLDSGKTAVRPADLQTELGAASPGVAGRMREGVRAEIDRVAGTNANDPAALQRMLKGEGDWNRAKLRMLYGTNADNALNSLDRETAFYRTANRVTSGSDTAMGAGFKDFLNEVATPRKIPTNTTVVGAAFRGIQEIVNAVRSGAAEQQAEQFAADLGRLSIATGPERDSLIQALTRYAAARQTGQSVADAARVGSHMLALGVGRSSSPLRVYLNAGERDQRAAQ